jgi:hypothetical protein
LIIVTSSSVRSNYSNDPPGVAEVAMAAMYRYAIVHLIDSKRTTVAAGFVDSWFSELALRKNRQDVRFFGFAPEGKRGEPRTDAGFPYWLTHG